MSLRKLYENYIWINGITLIILSLTRLANFETCASETLISIDMQIFDLCFARKLKYSNSSFEKLHSSLNLFNSGTVKS